MDIEPQWIVAGIIGLALLRLVSTWPRGKRAKLHRQWLELVDSILIALVLVFGVVQPFVVRAFFIPSESMEPTLMGSQAAGTGDRILVNRFIYELNPPVRGDIIVFRAPREALIASGAPDPTKPTDYVKRLIGLPGDRLQVRTGEGIYINGRLLKEPYILSPPDYDYPSADPQEWHVVPDDHYFVMGDNRNSSSDSHVWGDLPAENVLGKAMVIFWPVNRVHLL